MLYPHSLWINFSLKSSLYICLTFPPPFSFFPMSDCSLFPLNTYPSLLFSLSLSPPFLFVSLSSSKSSIQVLNGCRGNCLHPLPVDVGWCSCSNLSVRQRCLETSHIAFPSKYCRALTILNLSLSPNPHTSLSFTILVICVSLLSSPNSTLKKMAVLPCLIQHPLYLTLCLVLIQPCPLPLCNSNEAHWGSILSLWGAIALLCSMWILSFTLPTLLDTTFRNKANPAILHHIYILYKP